MSNSDFDRMISQRHAEHQDLGKHASFVRINPVSVLKGMLGNTATCATKANAQQSAGIDPMTGQPLFNAVRQVEPVALWRGEDAETGPVTVTFGVTQPPAMFVAGAGNAPLRPYGLVQFGTKGFLQTAKVDINNGCTFTVNASMITLSVGLEPTQESGLGTVQFQELSGMISFQPGNNNAPVTSTLYTAAAGNGTSTPTLAIPLFSKTLTVYRTFITTPPNQPAILLTLIDSAGAPIATFAAARDVAMQTIVIPNDAYFVSVTNTDVSDLSATLRLVFGLSL